jgi:hypothetical protein
MTKHFKSFCGAFCRRRNWVGLTRYGQLNDTVWIFQRKEQLGVGAAGPRAMRGEDFWPRSFIESPIWRLCVKVYRAPEWSLGDREYVDGHGMASTRERWTIRSGGIRGMLFTVQGRSLA